MSFWKNVFGAEKPLKLGLSGEPSVRQPSIVAPPPSANRPPQSSTVVHSASTPSVWTVPVGNGFFFPSGAAKAQALVTDWGQRGGGKIAQGVVWDLAAKEANAHHYDVAGELFRFFYEWLSKYNQVPDLQLTVAGASAVCFSRASGEDWPPSRSFFPEGFKENERWREALGHLATATFIAHAARQRLLRPTGGQDDEVQVVIDGTSHTVRAIVERTIPKIAIVPYNTSTGLDALANAVAKMGLSFPVRHMLGGAEDWW